MINKKLQQGDAKEAVLRAQSGSTALVAVVEDVVITLANVGDCRAGKTIHLTSLSTRPFRLDAHSICMNLVLGRVSPPESTVEAEALTIDQNGHNEKERNRIINGHPASEAENFFAGGRLFGHISTTRCELTSLCYRPI
jgi:serine/threonine protein phosphatase PrpC